MCSRKLFSAYLIIVYCLLLNSISYCAFEEMITISARAQGLGEAFASISDDPGSIFINPAGVGFVNKAVLSATYSKPYMDLENDSPASGFIGFLHPIMQGGNLTVAWAFFGASKYKENLFGLSFSYLASESLSAAVSLRSLSWDSNATIRLVDKAQQKLSGDGLGFDAGILYKPSEEVSIATALTNINQPNIVSDKAKVSDRVPLGIRPGVSFLLYNFLVSLDVIHLYYSDTNRIDIISCMGLERNLEEDINFPLIVRAGVNFVDRVNNITFGISYMKSKHTAWYIDYAFIYSNLDQALISHRFSFNISFEPFMFAPAVERVEEKEQMEELEEERGLEEERELLEKERRMRRKPEEEEE